jgi:hypothetical protein
MAVETGLRVFLLKDREFRRWGFQGWSSGFTPSVSEDLGKRKRQ